MYASLQPRSDAECLLRAAHSLPFAVLLLASNKLAAANLQAEFSSHFKVCTAALDDPAAAGALDSGPLSLLQPSLQSLS